MVHTRRLDQSSDPKREARAYLKRKGRKYLTRHVQKILEGSFTSSSSSSDASDSEAIAVKKLPSSSTRHRQSFSGRFTRRSLQPDLISSNKELYASDSGDSTSSETRILIETGRLDCIPRNKEFSVPLSSIPSNVSKKNNLSKSRRSLIPTIEAPPQIDLVSSDESSTERRALVENENVKKRLRNFPVESTSTERDLPSTFEKPKIPIRKTRRSLLPMETPTQKALAMETEANSIDESSNAGSNSRVERKQKFKRLLKKKLSRTRQTNISSGSDSGDSEVEITRKPGAELIPSKRKLLARNIRTPDEYTLFNVPEPPPRTRRSISIESSSSKDRRVTRNSLQNQTNEKISVARSSSTDRRVTRNSSLVDFYVKTLSTTSDRSIQNVTPQKDSSVGQSGSKDQTVIPSTSGQKKNSEKTSSDSQVKSTPSKSDFNIQNIQISLTRTPTTPRFLCPRPPKEITETITPIASCSNINQTTTQKETNGKTVEDHLEIEDLLRTPEGSGDSEEEINSKRSSAKQKRKVSSKKISRKNKTADTSKESSHDQEDLDSGKKNKKSENCDGTCSRYDKYVTNISKSLCENAAQCGICKKFFHSLPTLNRHTRMIHENKVDFKCKTCGKKFPRLDYMKTHERLQHSENPYFTCKYCDKNFRYKTSRNIHERLHTGENPFKCGVCGIKFIRKDYYKKHRLQHDIKRAKFICDECDQPFVDKFSLQIHIQHHMQIKKNTDNEDFQVEVIQLFINDDWD